MACVPANAGKHPHLASARFATVTSLLSQLAPLTRATRAPDTSKARSFPTTGLFLLSVETHLQRSNDLARLAHSHSMVAGGFELMS